MLCFNWLQPAPGISNTNNKREKGMLIYFIFIIWACQVHFSMLNQQDEMVHLTGLQIKIDSLIKA
ncbi:hypothetical protein A4D02_32010 [Niastella koreensis]|uniref:Uncharacterized protein n=2 Tax=Niastella koreensis TaxID=354356 RepID=G8TAP7_NIAKG|nr:hypothetical protein Niako_2894 [Niastella koreensis GR20-10]OQP46182.1 hypothetical protein A4D02_32010 [Niastella koreensis]